MSTEQIRSILNTLQQLDEDDGPLSFAVLQSICHNFSKEEKNEIMRAIRIEMRRSGATDEQMEQIKKLHEYPGLLWYHLAKNSVKFAKIEEKWEFMNFEKIGEKWRFVGGQVSEEDMQELIYAIIEYTANYFMQSPT